MKRAVSAPTFGSRVLRPHTALRFPSEPWCVWNQCSRLVLWQGAREVCLHTHHQRTFLIVGLVSRLNYCHSSRWEPPARHWGLRYPCGYLPLPPWLSFRSPAPLLFLPYLTSRKQQVWPDSHSPICHSWIAVLIITLLGHIDCLNSRA